MRGQKTPEYIDDLIAILQASTARWAGGGTDHPSLSLGGGSDPLLTLDTANQILTLSTIHDPVTLGGGSDPGLTLSGQEITLGGPDTLSVNSEDEIVGAGHSHAINWSADPGAASYILGTDADGGLELEYMGIGSAPNTAGDNRLRLGGNIQFTSGNREIALGNGVLTIQGGQSGDNMIITTDGQLLLQSTGGDLSLDPDGGQVDPASNYAVSLGQEANKYLALYAAELVVDNIVARDVIATIGGRIIVTPTTALAADLGNSSTSMIVAHNFLEGGDIVILEGGGNVEWIEIGGWSIIDGDASNDELEINGDITSQVSVGDTIHVSNGSVAAIDGSWTVDTISYSGGSGTTLITTVEDITGAASGYTGDLDWFQVSGAVVYDYPVLTRNLDGSGANDWLAGRSVMSTGQADDGWIELYADSSLAATSGPTIVGNQRLSGTYDDYTEAWAIGNLDGLYGYGADQIGVALGAYQEGPWITIDDKAGISIYEETGILTGNWAPGGDLTLGQVATDQANLFFDQSAGRLNFRGGASGTAVELYLDTDGTLVAGGGDVVIGSGGIQLQGDAASETSALLAWNDGAGSTFRSVYKRSVAQGGEFVDWYGSDVEEIRMEFGGSTIPAGFSWFDDLVNSPAGRRTRFRIYYGAEADSYWLEADTTMDNVGTSPTSHTLSLNADEVNINADADVAGVVRYTSTLQSRKNSTNYTVYGVAPETEPGTNTSWNGDSKSAGTYTLDMQNWGVPNNATGVFLMVRVTDAQANTIIRVRYPGATNSQLTQWTQVANQEIGISGYCPVNGSGELELVLDEAVSSVWVLVQGYTI